MKNFTFGTVERNVGLSVGVGAAAGGALTYKAYSKIKKNVLDPLDKKLQQLEQKCEKCGIHVKKPNNEYEKNPNDNIEERFNNLKKTVDNLKFSKFGGESGGDDILKSGLYVGSGALSAYLTSISGMMVGGVKLALIKRKVNKIILELKDIEHKIDSYCKGKMKKSSFGYKMNPKLRSLYKDLETLQLVKNIQQSK